MTVQTSAIPATITALVAACQALTDPGESLDDVTVIDGPPKPGVATSDKDRLFIGYDPDSDTAVEGAQEVAGQPGRSRNEEFTITCLAEAWTGDTDIAPRRARAFAIVAAVEALVRPTVGSHTLGVSSLLWAQVTGTERLKQQQTSSGAVAGVVFTVACKARLSIV